MVKSYSYIIIFAVFCDCVTSDNRFIGHILVWSSKTFDTIEKLIRNAFRKYTANHVRATKRNYLRWLGCIHVFYYIKQCHIYDENVNQCIRDSTNHLIANMRNGIPELGLEDPEPVLIDQIQLAIGSGPDGYRAIFRDIEAYGVSNCTVTAVRSDIETNQFQFTIHIPKITARAKYESSGILILVRASGGGNYWGEYEGIKVKSYIKADKEIGDDGLTYLRLQQIKMDFNVRDIKMGVDGIHNGNSVLQAALNLFINSNAQELLKEMKPHLKKKFLLLMSDFITNIFNNVPYDAFLTEE